MKMIASTDSFHKGCSSIIAGVILEISEVKL